MFEKLAATAAALLMMSAIHADPEATPGPMVKAGRLVVEVHSSWLAKGSTVK